MEELTKVLLRHRLGVGAGMVLVGLVAAGLLAERKHHPPTQPAAPEEPEAPPLPSVGRAGLLARIAAAHGRRRSPKTYSR